MDISKWFSYSTFQTINFSEFKKSCLKESQESFFKEK